MLAPELDGMRFAGLFGRRFFWRGKGFRCARALMGCFRCWARRMDGAWIPGGGCVTRMC